MNKIISEVRKATERKCRLKVVGTPEEFTKIEEKTWISGGSMQKNGKFQGGHSKFDWKSRGSTSKKSISSGKAHCSSLEI